MEKQSSSSSSSSEWIERYRKNAEHYKEVLSSYQSLLLNSKDKDQIEENEAEFKQTLIDREALKNDPFYSGLFNVTRNIIG